MSSSNVPFNAARPAVGVRPLSGAAGSGLASTLGSSKPPRLVDVAAPEDGRTPVVPQGYAPGVVAVCLLLAALAGSVLFCFDPRQYHFYPVCFFHRTTGLLCPGCGALRGLHQLLHGHLAAAFRFNPMLVVSLPFVIWFGARYGLQQARNQPFSLGLRPVWLWLTLAVVLVVSVLRNLPGVPFALLRP